MDSSDTCGALRLAGEGKAVALRSAFGFDRADEAWMALVHDAVTPVGLGTLGSYNVLEEIGRGAQGAVFKAVQPGTQRTIAVKRLAAGAFAGDKARARFEREVEATAALSHPGIVTVFGTEMIDGQPILLMEWVDGRPIDRWALDGEPPHSIRERIALFAEVCDAVAHAHQRGVLHRDLKPSNILVDRQGRPRILDFGLARVMGEASCLSAIPGEGHGLLGTPAYAAPEQLDASQIDTRTDVYSLGVVFFQILTGHLPFEQAALPELMEAIRHQAPRRPSRINPDLDDELDAIILTALAKEQDRRYQSADALAADVRRYLGGQIVLAHPPSAAYQLRKLVARHRLSFGIAAAAVIAVAALAIVSSVLATRLATRSRDLAAALANAEDERDRADSEARHAVAARQNAQTQAARSAASAEFLESMLESMSRAVNAGDARPARAMVLDAKARLEAGNIEMDPELEVSLWRRLATTGWRLGMVRETAEFTDRAVELCEARLDSTHPEMGECKILLGLRAESRRELPLAESLYREAYRMLLAAQGMESKESARAANNLAIILGQQGRFDESLRLHQQVLAVRIELFGPIHRDVALSLCNIGALMRDRRQYDEAAKYLQQALDVATQAGPLTDSAANKIRTHLARVARDQGRYDEAECLYRENLGVLEQVHGADSAALVKVLMPLADVVARSQRYSEAAAFSARALALSVRHYPPGHAQIPTAQLHHAGFLLKDGRREEAELLATTAADLADCCDPPSPQLVTRAQNTLAKCRNAGP